MTRCWRPERVGVRIAFRPAGISNASILKKQRVSALFFLASLPAQLDSLTPRGRKQRVNLTSNAFVAFSLSHCLLQGQNRFRPAGVTNASIWQATRSWPFLCCIASCAGLESLTPPGASNVEAYLIPFLVMFPFPKPTTSAELQWDGGACKLKAFEKFTWRWDPLENALGILPLASPGKLAYIHELEEKNTLVITNILSPFVTKIAR